LNNQEIKTLKILEEIGSGDVPSQRDLAKKLNISLGLVNSFLKRLARKGYLKITTIPSNRVAYLLTPKGAVEKTRLTYAFIQYSYHFYKDARIKLKELFSDLARQNVKRVAFYGATDLAEIAFISLQETDLELVAIFDTKKSGSRFLGIEIEHPKRLPEFSYDRLLYTSERPDEEFFEQTDKEKIVLIK
jgi:DNA-binding MarR family transcriptional regulator